MAALTELYKDCYILYTIWHPNWHFVETPCSQHFRGKTASFAFQLRSTQVRKHTHLTLGSKRNPRTQDQEK